MVSKLHSEFNFSNGIKSQNRFALAPMTTSQSLASGRLSADEFLWLKQFALGGFGIVFTCASHISLEGQGWDKQLGIWNDSFIPSLKILTDNIKYHGSLCIMQICHNGIRSASSITRLKLLNVNDISVEKIHKIIEEFGESAYRAEQAGFDGIEIHGANGYLITQFISVQTNMRTDEYGGKLENRARFLLEVLKCCRSKVSPNFLIGFRISPENFGVQTGLKLEENIEITKWATQFSDYVHISTWDALKPNLILNFRNALNNFPIFIAGGIQSISQAQLVLDEGATFVSLGKIAIGNPYFPIKSQNQLYQPNLPPYSDEYLNYCHVSSSFKNLLKVFPNLME